MPYGLTTFQVITWLQQKKSPNSFTYKALDLYLHLTQNKLAKWSLQPLSLPSYVLGGGMSPVPKNSVPGKVSLSPGEIC